jgi:hypothetical protein
MIISPRAHTPHSNDPPLSKVGITIPADLADQEVPAVVYDLRTHSKLAR